MAQRGVSLLDNVGSTGAGDYKVYSGGASVLVLMGTFPTTLTFEMLGKDGTTAIILSTPTVAGISNFDLPPGKYRMNVVGGSPSGLFADLVGVIHT